MPELPEVENARRALSAIALGKTITHAETWEDTIVYSGVDHAAFRTSVLGKTVERVGRKGKTFFLVLTGGISALLHFGMSGEAQVKGGTPFLYKQPKKASTEWPPKYTKLVLQFGTTPGAEWAFVDARRLGRIKLVQGTSKPEDVEPLSLLGPDAFLALPAAEVLGAAFGKKSAPIKAVLLDQNGPVCGLGNWMVDEILYQARIHPATPASRLSQEEISELHKHIEEVTRLACEVDADSSRFPGHWIFSVRWGKGKTGSGKVKLGNGDEVTLSFVTVGGRTSAVVDAVQRLNKAVKPPKALKAPIKDVKDDPAPKRKKRKAEAVPTTPPEPGRRRTSSRGKAAENAA